MAEPGDRPERVVVVTRSSRATRSLGAILAGLVEPGDVLLLSGGLGAGKTTLTKGLVAALGAVGEVTSPTFTLLRTYATEPVVAHVDCWRLEQLGEIGDLGLDELLDDGAVAVVEWGEAAEQLLGEDALHVVIDVAKDVGDVHGDVQGDDAARDVRVVTVTAGGPSWVARLACLVDRALAEGLDAR